MRHRLPAWLVDELKQGRSQQELVRHATGTLTDAMLFAGVGQPNKSDCEKDAVRVWAKGLEVRLWNLPRRTGLRGSQLAESRQRFVAALASRVLAATGSVEVATARPWARSDLQAALTQVKGGLSLAAEVMTRHNRRPPTISEIPEPFATPHLALQAAYHSMAANQNELVVVPSDVKALSLFGLASHALVKMRRCHLCFRWALPGHQYCGQHTLSAEVGGSPNERQARYQSGQRARSHFEKLLREVPGRFGRITSEVRGFVVARLLWRASVPDEQRIAVSVSKLLPTYPLTHQEVGHGEERRTTKLFDTLRERLDPLEFSPGNWHTKLRAAEAWFAAVEYKTPGRRGPGRKTRSRVVDVWSLVRDFAESKSSAAAILGLHPSAISYWLRYKSEDPAVRALAQELIANREKTLAKRKARKRAWAYVDALRDSNKKT